MATATELRSKTVDEMQKALVELKKEQFNLRFQKANMTLENTARIRVVRREIARAKTIIGQAAADKGEA